MKTVKQILSAVRGALGWSDLSETRLSPPHGWLLPGAAELRAERAHVDLRAASHVSPSNGSHAATAGVAGFERGGS
jgi:hypothetical protein